MVFLSNVAARQDKKIKKAELNTLNIDVLQQEKYVGPRNFGEVRRKLQKWDDFGESQPTFEISVRISRKLSGNLKSCLSF